MVTVQELERINQEHKLNEIKKKIRDDFESFFDAMITKMASKYEERGDSWKRDQYVIGYYHRYSSMPSIPHYADMLPLLIESLEKEIKEWEESNNAGELVDIANFCGMIWWHVDQVLSVDCAGERTE